MFVVCRFLNELGLFLNVGGIVLSRMNLFEKFRLLVSILMIGMMRFFMIELMIFENVLLMIMLMVRFIMLFLMVNFLNFLMMFMSGFFLVGGERRCVVMCRIVLC